MTVTRYDGPRLCPCGRPARVLIDAAAVGDQSHVTLLCWRCANALVRGLVEASETK